MAEALLLSLTPSVSSPVSHRTVVDTSGDDLHHRDGARVWGIQVLHPVLKEVTVGPAYPGSSK